MVTVELVAIVTGSDSSLSLPKYTVIKKMWLYQGTA